MCNISSGNPDLLARESNLKSTDVEFVKHYSHHVLSGSCGAYKEQQRWRFGCYLLAGTKSSPGSPDLDGKGTGKRCKAVPKWSAGLAATLVQSSKCSAAAETVSPIDSLEFR